VKPVACCSELHGRTPPPALLVPLPFQGRLFIQALLKSEAILPHTPTKTAHFRQTHRKRAVLIFTRKM